MGIDDLVGDKRQDVLDLAEKHGVYNVRVFGSVARGDANPNSDVDFLVDFQPHVGMDFLARWGELEDLLGREVDLITERSLNERAREQILSEAVRL